MPMNIVDLLHDLRVVSRSANLNGKHYHYLLGVPTVAYKATVFLIHGFPDLSIGWRNQIPFLLDLGYRVICPDMMGYGGTEAPHVPPESLSFYGFKRAADDIKALADHLGVGRIILGGHDWGGAIVHHTHLYHPRLTPFLFTVCTPYFPPTPNYTSLPSLVARRPNLAYQLQFASPDLESRIVSKPQIRQFLNGIFGGKTPAGKQAFHGDGGLDLESLKDLKQTELMSDDMLDYYTSAYAIHGLHGPCNWYRTRQINYEDDVAFLLPPSPSAIKFPSRIQVPTLFISASKDGALPPDMSNGMGKLVPYLTRREVDAGHWALWERAEEVNAILGEWLRELRLEVGVQAMERKSKL